MRLLAGAEHFQVEEVPAYEPCGTGEHLFVWIEKRGITTDAVVSVLARASGIPERSVGYAGRKDRHAVARQWFSLHGSAESDLATLAGKSERIEVLRVERHRNKLRLGHLRGNRFVLGLAEPAPGLRAGLEALARRGVPNRFGPQRFGVGGANLEVAREWGGGAPPRGSRRYRKLVASAAQGAIFNAVVDARERVGLLRRLRAGDVAQLPSGASFVCESADLEDLNSRADRLEVLATGPLPGTRRFGPSPEIEAEERDWSGGAGVDWGWFDRGGPLESPGERRAAVVAFLEPPDLDTSGGDTRMRFALPAGSYATEVLAALGVALPDDRAGAA